MRWSSWSDLQPEVRKLYGDRDYQPLWTEGIGPTAQALRVVGLLGQADTLGLDVADYDIQRWKVRAAALKVGSEVSEAVEVELALTVILMRFLDDLHGGRVDARGMANVLDLPPKRLDLSVRVQELARAEDLAGTVQQLEPPFPAYRRLKEALLRYRELAQIEDIAAVPVVPLLRPGDTYDGTSALAHFLRRVGDLEPGPDGAPESELYEGDLVTAVEQFQRRHGLKVDGKIGPETFAALNTPLSHRELQIRLALERWRWVPIKPGAAPVVVNIPEFRLRAFDPSGQVTLDMAVVVGRAFHSETPVFADQIRTVVLRPSWFVPPSITRTDVLPRLAKDPDYLENLGFEITGTGDRELTEENLESLRRGSLTLRQRPGRANALGRVKFLFPNRYNIYLHDTPSTGLFAEARRDFSHGCIRVADPEGLATWLLREQPDWNAERIREAMTSGPTDRAVPLPTPIPVLIVYVTAVAREEGEISFFEDIYGHDKRLAQALSVSPGRRPGEPKG